ncbi:MAG: CocE/NonD family hydrolase, partial [Phycisphaerae bacterium]
MSKLSIRTFAAACAVLAAGGGASAAGAEKKLSVMVPMSDGVRLATDVYLPGGEGPWPAVLSRTPYNKGRGGGGALARRGYAVVKQDMRGRFASKGENLPFIGCGWVDHRDGADTIAWVRRQGWCNGKVATTGGSALGITQNLMAPTAPEGLLAQYIVVAAASMYHHATYVGGALRKSQVEGWLRGNRFDPNAMRMFAQHPAYDEWWQGFDAVRECGRITAPAMHVGGWFDTFSAGTVAAFVSRQHKGGKGAKGRQKLVMGPWAHGIGAFGKVGELRFPKAALPPKYNATSWFDHHLKGEDGGAKDLPAVAYYVMGDTSDRSAPGNEWRFADDWPVPCKPTAYYLHADGRLSTARPPGVAGKMP